ncbi:MAG: hypothetical protein RBR40_13385, partial [Tenuifilaceae bacterium]|nr:hypothetical protein [Tenuifilaceae bacterium]
KLKKWSSILCMLLFVVVGGCDKEDYTLPVKFDLGFSIKNDPILAGTITINEIGLGLKSIDIQGYREQGDDVFFTRNFEKLRNVKLKLTSTRATESFDIPQGTYNPISFSYTFQPDDEEDDLIEDILDWLEDFENLEEEDDLKELKEDLGEIIEDYLEDINPCFMVKGTFISNSKTKHLVMVVNNPLTFKTLGKNKNGGSEVTLDKSFVNSGNLQFNPAYWFSAITPAMLNNAIVGTINDEEYIFLSKYINSTVYGTIYNRIEESTTLRINE